MLGTCYEIKRKRGSIWKVQFRLAGVYIYEKFTDEQEARRFQQKNSDRLEWEAAKGAGPRATLPESGSLLDEELANTLELFLEDPKCSDGAKQTLPTVIAKVKGAKDAKGVTLGLLDETWIENFIDDMRASTTCRGTQFAYSTILKQATNIKLAMKWRAKKLKVSAPPFLFSTNMFPKGWQVKRERRLELSEERALLARFATLEGPGRDFWPLLMGLAIETGCRQSELVNLPWSELHERNGNHWWLLPKPRTKAKKARPIPLTARAVALLKQARELEDPNSPRVFHAFSSAAVVSALFHRHVKALGIVDLRWHDLRHEGISRFVLTQRRFTVDQIMTISGHRSREMLDLYTNLRGDELAALLV